MIKKYLEYIKENNSYVHKELIKMPELDQIIDDILIDFLEDNNLICELQSTKIYEFEQTNQRDIKIKNTYYLSDKFIIQSNCFYRYGYHISFKENNDNFLLDDSNSKLIQNKLNKFYDEFKLFKTINSHGQRISYYILGTPIKYSEKDVLNYYNISGYKEDNEGFYVELSFDDLAEMCLEKNSVYKIYFTSTDSIWDSYYDYDYDYDGDFYLNKENKEKYSLLEDEELVSDIKRTIEDYERDAQVEKNLEELWIEFIYQLKGLKVELVKGKYYPYILDSNESKDNSFFKVYFVNRLLNDVYDQIQNMSLYELINEYFYNYGRISLNPQFSSYGDVDTDSLNKDVSNLLKNL